MSKSVAKPAKRTQIERQIVITYRWWRSDDKPLLPSDTFDDGPLEEHAQELIAQMQREGYTSGELYTELYHEDELVAYNGWWEMTVKTL